MGKGWMTKYIAKEQPEWVAPFFVQFTIRFMQIGCTLCMFYCNYFAFSEKKFHLCVVFLVGVALYGRNGYKQIE